MTETIAQTSTAYYITGETAADKFAFFEKLTLPALPAGESFVSAELAQYFAAQDGISTESMNLRAFTDASWTAASADSYFLYTTGDIWDSIVAIDSGDTYAVTAGMAAGAEWTSDLTAVVAAAYALSGGAETTMTLCTGYYFSVPIASPKKSSGSTALSTVQIYEKSPERSITWHSFGAASPYTKTLTIVSSALAASAPLPSPMVGGMIM